MVCLSPIAVVVSLSFVAPAGDPAWSDDGSAEAAALQRRVAAHDEAEVRREVGERGFVFVPQDPGGAATPGTPTTPGTDVPPPEPGVVIGDLERQAEIERIVRKGRRLFIPGIVLSTLGTIFTIGGIAGVAKQPSAASGGFLGASLVIAAIGWPMAIAGIRRRRHPEKFLRPELAAVGPGGFAVRF